MRSFLLFSLTYLLVNSLSGQPLVFAHNDYQKLQPLTRALAVQADFIGASVFLRNGKLVLANTAAEADTSRRTLEDTYLNPMVALFERYKDRLTDDRRYAPTLVIDLKDKADEMLPVLLPMLEKNLAVFSQAISPRGVRVVVSGNRPRPETYLDYPSYLFFDGRPSELYDEETARRVALISDNFRSYARWDGTGDVPDDDRAKLKRIIKRAHDAGCPIRFWNAPDTPDAWKKLRKLGIDVINTDKIDEYRAAVK